MQTHTHTKETRGRERECKSPRMQTQILTLHVKPDRQHHRRPWRAIAMSTASYNCIVLSGHCFWRYQSVRCHPHPLSLCLKVTLRICQSLTMTLALSVIHHVACVSARCRTSRAVGGPSGSHALYNMQIITCKLSTHVCDSTLVSIQMQHAIRYVCQPKKLQASQQILSENEKVTRSSWILGRNVIVTHTHTHKKLWSASCCAATRDVL